MHHDRADKVLSGTPAEQVAEAVALLAERGALDGSRSRSAWRADQARSSRAAGSGG